MTDEEILRAAQDFRGERRFYPAGQHPATARLREHLEQLLALGLSEEHESVVYARSRIALFEWGEDRDKRDYLSRVRGAREP